MTKDANLSRLALHGTFWSYLSFIGGKLLTFASTVVLARLLVPSEFGLMGYCMIAIQYLDLLMTFGLDAALIARSDKLEEAANANFIIGLVSGFFLYALTWFTAPLIAVFFNEPKVTELLRVVALVLPLSALGIVPGALLQRELRFRAKLIPDLVRNFSKGLVSIVLAFQGAGVWSLVAGQIVGELVTTLLLWPMARWRPSWKFDRQVFRDSLGFGSHILIVGIVGAILTNIDYVFVGRILGATALGIYTLGYRLPELLIKNFNTVIARVSFPMLARIQQDHERIRRVYLKYIGYIALFAFPAGVGLACISAPFIMTLYTQKWAATIPVMQAISIALAISAIGHAPGVLYKAIGRPEILNLAALIKVPFALIILWLGTYWGILGVAIAQIGVALCNAIVDTVLVRRILQVSFVDIVRAIWPAFLSALCMGLVLTVINIWLLPQGIVGMVLLVAVGGLIFFAMLYTVNRQTITSAQQLFHTVLPAARKG